MDNESINADQFDVITQLLRGDRFSAANRAARAVLIEGMKQVDAVRTFHVTRSTVCDAVRRYRNADMKIRRAYVPPNEE